MSTSPIRIHFTTQPNLMLTQQRLLAILREKFEIELVDKNPDYLIGCAFDMAGDLERYPRTIKILFTGENICPDFNVYDYAIGFDHLQFGDRYMRLPLYCFYPDFDKLCSGDTNPVDYAHLTNRKFCCFVVSNGNGSNPIRTEFFHALSKYKKVDSAGRYLNNMGGAYLADKRAFVSEYKFNIAFENSAVDGYTTEKVMEPMTINTIPIYWGNPSVGKDFNPKSFINLSEYCSMDKCIQRIIELDKDDEQYLAMLRQPYLNADGGYRDYKQKIWNFFAHIFEQTMEDAKRISDYGFQMSYRDNLTRYEWVKPHYRTLWRVNRILNFFNKKK